MCTKCVADHAAALRAKTQELKTPLVVDRAQALDFCPGSRVTVYSVKFICGVQPECRCECGSVQPGKYATEINIHNYSLKEIYVQKRFVPVVLAGAPAGREPRTAAVRAHDKITLSPRTATMDDCCRIAELLFGGTAPSPIPLIIGFLELTASADIAVTAAYTTSGLKSCGVSIVVKTIAGQRQ